MKAIDRAAYWTEVLEQAGYDIECETEEMFWGMELMTVTATKHHRWISYTIRMDTKFTRFAHGASNGRRDTRKPQDVSVWVSIASVGVWA